MNQRCVHVAQSADALRTGARPARTASPSLSAAPTSAAICDIERTTRQRIAVAPLPADFTAAAEAIKRLKPATKAQPERRHTKADRRQDGQRRQNRNSGQQRHPQRTEGHHAHRPEGGQPNRKFYGRRRRSGGTRAA